MSKKPLNVWYEDGLKFKCTGCGKCCTGAPGYVWLTDDDIEKFADHFKISQKEFLQKYTRYVKGHYSLNEIPKHYDCVFFKDTKCTVYNARPKQCRTFPFWDENLKSKEAWDSVAIDCEGINHKDAPVIPLSEIKKFREE